MTYKREYKRARWKLRQAAKSFRRTGLREHAEFVDLSKHPAIVCMTMKVRGLDQSFNFIGLYDAWHNVLRALENLHRHTNTKLRVFGPFSACPEDSTPPTPAPEKPV